VELSLHSAVKPVLELADVFAEHFADYLKVAHCTAEQWAAVNAILKCRTAALGGHLRECDVCGGCRWCTTRAAIATARNVGRSSGHTS
jgi:hypothetical protein